MKFWMMPDSGSNTAKDAEKFFNGFRKENPGAELEVEVFTRDRLWRNLFLLAFEEDALALPDVVEIPHVWTPLLIKENLAENLTQLDPGLALNSYLAPLVPHCYKKNTKDIYALPWWMDISALHYRVDHLAKVTDNPAKELASWDGFLKTCSALKEEFKDVQKYYPLQNGDWRGSLSSRNMLPFIWGKGTDLTDKTFTECLFTQKDFVDCMDAYITLAVKKYMPILVERGSVGTMVAGKASLFLTRRQGSIFENSKHDFKVKTLPVPTAGEHSVGYISGINLTLMKKSKDKDTAFAFIKWLSRPDNQLRYAQLMEVFPALEETFEKFIFSSPERMQTYAKIIAGGRALANNLVLPSATKILNEILDRCANNVLQGTYSRAFLEKELAYGAKEVNYLLALYEGL